MTLKPKRCARLLVCMLAVLFVSMPNASTAQAPPPNLLTDPGTRGATGPGADPTVLRERLSAVDLDLLGGDGWGTGTPTVPPVSAITLNLFGDANLVAVLERLEPLPSIGGNGYVWIGTVQGAELSQVILVVVDGITAANVRLPGGSYQIRPAGSGLHVVREIDEATFPESSSDYVLADPLPGEAAQGGARTLAQGQIGPAADDGTIIDLMVPYTAAAKDGTGGKAAMHALINLGMVETNESYANSGINFRVRLVHAYQVSYTEVGGTLSTDLSRLRNDGDGYLDDVHARRDAYAADLVSLWIEPGDYCGRGYLFYHGIASYGFNVVKRSCAMGNLTFGHEMGHNMGARHDWYVDETKFSAPGGLSDNHGRVNVSAQWRTVMAYNSLCSDQTPSVSCTRVLYFSNPNVSYASSPTGFAAGTNTICTAGNTSNPDCDADNARVLDANAYAVANFRESTLIATVTKSVVPSAVFPGETLTFTLVVSNVPGVTANEITITDTVPAHTVLDTNSLSGDASYSGTGPGSVITWTTGISLGPDQSLSRTFYVTATTGGKVTNVAYVSVSNAPGVHTSNVVEATINQVALCGFSDSFEDGSLSDYWRTHTTYDGRIRVTGVITDLDFEVFSPHTGSYHVILDDSRSDTQDSAAGIILTLDLTGQTDFTLDFWWLENWDEYQSGQDGVFFSDDYGATWCQVYPLDDPQQSYKHAMVGLDAEAASCGMTLNDHFQIKFQSYDNNYFENNDGFAIDDVRVTCAAPEITVLGNGLAINSGDILPSTADGTDFGSVFASDGAMTHTFTISNPGSIPLNLTGTPLISVTGHSTDFVVVVDPSTPIPAGGTTGFQVRFDPTITGTRSATIDIATDDPDESLYTYAIQGEGALPTLTFSQAVYEVNEDGTPVGASVTLTRNTTTGTSSVHVVLVDGTATGGTPPLIYPEDYDDTSQTITFTDGENSVTVTVTVGDDAVDEDDEVLTMTLSVPANGAIGTLGTAVLQINDDDHAPVAQPDIYNTALNQTLTVSATAGVLHNDVDANGDPLTVTLVSTATSGALNFEFDGSFVYTPTLDFSGVITFSYVASDGVNASDVAVVAIGVSNSAPQFTSTPVTTTTVGVSYAYTITTADVDGDRLVITATKPAWLSLTDNGDGTALLGGTPVGGDVGDHLILLQVSDGILTDTQRFTVTVESRKTFLPIILKDWTG